MLKRTAAMAMPAVLVMLAVVLMVGALSGAAQATEAPSHFREYSEIRENASDVGAEFLPDEYDIPGFFDWLIIPLVAAGVLITVAVLLRYLIAHPRFEREAKAKERSRR